MWREGGRVAIKHEKRREERGMEEVEEEVVEVRKRREEEAESRREQGEQTVEWKEVVVSRDFSLRIIFLIFLFQMKREEKEVAVQTDLLDEEEQVRSMIILMRIQKLRFLFVKTQKLIGRVCRLRRRQRGGSGRRGHNLTELTRNFLTLIRRWVFFSQYASNSELSFVVLE